MAEDRLTDEDIAAKNGITRRTLAEWKLVPAFRERVEALLEQRRKRLWRYRLARDEEMMADLERDYGLHEQVRQERAEDPTMASVAGGTTGLILREFKSVGSGPGARVVPVYEEDHAWFKTRLALQDQARKILGKDKQRLELTGRDGGPIAVAAVDLRQRLMEEMERTRLQVLEGGKVVEGGNP